MFGYRRDELVGYPIDLLAPVQLPKCPRRAPEIGYFAQPRSRPMGAGLRLAGRRKDGSEVPVETGSLSPLETEQGVLRHQRVIRDVSQPPAKRARCRTLVEQLPAVTFLMAKCWMAASAKCT